MVRHAHEDDGERALVDRARRGDADAFGHLFRAHHPRVYRLARAQLPHNLAEDAAAETFTRAWKALPRYHPTRAPFVGWLYGIARHVVVDMVRLQARTDPTDHVVDEGHDPWLGRDDLLALADAIRGLPDEQRAVIELKFLVGLTNGEVAVVLDKLPGAVNAQQWRALRALQRVLEPR